MNPASWFIAAASADLANAGIEGAANDARRLMAHVLGIEPSRMTLHMGELLTLDQRDAFEEAILRRAAREPVSHILGQRQFYGREFEVTADVLDPRGDTETLIAEALKAPFEDVLDLGTGSGAILVTLLAESDATGIGTDISEAAVSVAERNAARNGVDERCAFLISDWFDGVAGDFDLIVSNPPYIAADEMDGLAPELSYEPRIALTDEADGLSAYRIICTGAAEHLKAGGRLMAEIGWTQGAAVAEMMREAGLCDVQVIQDLDGRDRVVSARKSG